MAGRGGKSPWPKGHQEGQRAAEEQDWRGSRAGRSLLGTFPTGGGIPAVTKSSFNADPFATQLGKSLGGSMPPPQLPSALLCCTRCPSAVHPASCRPAWPQAAGHRALHQNRPVPPPTLSCPQKPGCPGSPTRADPERHRWWEKSSPGGDGILRAAAVTSFQTAPGEKERERKRERRKSPTVPTASQYLRLYPVETPEPQDLPAPQLHFGMVNLIHVFRQFLLWDLLLGDAMPSFFQELQVAGWDSADQLGRGRERAAP